MACFPVASIGQAQSTIRFDLPEQPLAASLRAVGSLTSTNVVFDPAIVSGLNAPRVLGSFTADGAFAALLVGTRLRHSFLDHRTVMVTSLGAVGNAPEASPAHVQAVNAARSESSQRAAGSDFGPQRDSAARPGKIVSEVIVSARRRDERLQSVPMSIHAMDGDELEARTIESVENLVQNVPNVVVANNGFGQSNFSIRGIQGAGVFIDGTFQQSLVGASRRNLIEVAHVEVLRGPQGTLFGRDTTGGAIRIFSTVPSETFGVRATAVTGSYRRHDLIVHADVPIHQTLLSKFSLVDAARDGYVESILTGRKTGDVDDRNLRADFLWRPSERFQARFTTDALKSRSTQPNYMPHLFDPPPEGVGPGLGFQVPAYQYYEILGVPYDCRSVVAGCRGGRVGDLQTADNFSGPPGLQLDELNYNLKLDWQIADTLKLSSLTNYSDIASWGYANADVAPVDYYSAANYIKRFSWSQEFQLNAQAGERIDYVLGAYAWDTNARVRVWSWPLWDFSPGGGPDARYTFASLAASPLCADPMPGLLPCARNSLIAVNSLTAVEQDGQAYFGEITFKLTDTVSATVGGRYHRQTNSTTSLTPAANVADIPAVPGQLPDDNPVAFISRGAPREDDFSKRTFRVSLMNAFTPDVSVYASWAQGYNAGGASRVNVPDGAGRTRTADFTYDPETISSSELGLRSEWLESTLRANLTAFHTRWKDIQLQGTVRDPLTGTVLPQFVTQNAAAATARGVEAALAYRPIRELLLHLDVGLLDTEYTQISENVSRDLKSGDGFGRAPTVQASAGVQWTRPLGRYQLMLRTDYNYTSGYMRTYIPSNWSTRYSGERWEVPAMGLLQARVTLVPARGIWEFALFGTNLTDERYVPAGFMSPLVLLSIITSGLM
ncbi:MAG: TonB-dependent receptor, partial [Pseudomonadota bacterium]|nr:TonB-dependent receptor [Pseudomonadota bacterium]